MFKKTKLAAALAATVAATGVQAVHINPDGSGQVLLFSYYNVNNGFQTNFQIRNTTDQFKAIKVRFRESDTSLDVIDFNVYMTPYDVWEGVVRVGPNGVPNISTDDTTCTLPRIPSFEDGGADFQGDQYAALQGSLSQNEGYIEVFEMGVLDGDSLLVTGYPTVVNGEYKLANPTVIDDFLNIDVNKVSVGGEDLTRAIWHDPDEDVEDQLEDCDIIDDAWITGVFNEAGAFIDVNGGAAGATGPILDDDYVWQTDAVTGELVDSKGCILQQTGVDPSGDPDFDVWECASDGIQGGDDTDNDDRVVLTDTNGNPIIEQRVVGEDYIPFGEGGATVDGIPANLSTPTGGLTGSTVLLQFEDGYALVIDPTALDGYANMVVKTDDVEENGDNGFLGDIQTLIDIHLDSEDSIPPFEHVSDVGLCDTNEDGSVNTNECGLIPDVQTGAQHYLPSNLFVSGTSSTEYNYLLPSLASGNVKTSEIPSNSGTMTITTAWPQTSVDIGYYQDLSPRPSIQSGVNPFPVAHALAAKSLNNQYFIDPVFDGGTDWIVTFPMRKHGIFNGKHFDDAALPPDPQVNPTLAPPTSGGGPLFGEWFDLYPRYVMYGPDQIYPRGGNFVDNAQDDVGFSFRHWDREEQSPRRPPDFSPPELIPPERPVLTREVNIITFANGDVREVLGSEKNIVVQTGGDQWDKGWADITFANQFVLSSAASAAEPYNLQPVSNTFGDWVDMWWDQVDDTNPYINDLRLYDYFPVVPEDVALATVHGIPAGYVVIASNGVDNRNQNYAMENPNGFKTLGGGPREYDFGRNRFSCPRGGINGPELGVRDPHEWCVAYYIGVPVVGAAAINADMAKVGGGGWLGEGFQHAFERDGDIKCGPFDAEYPFGTCIYDDVEPIEGVTGPVEIETENLDCSVRERVESESGDSELDAGCKAGEDVD